MSTKNIFIAILCIAFSVCLMSCTDKMTPGELITKTHMNDIPYFEDEEEYLREFRIRMELASEGLRYLKEYEQLHGYSSIGVIADEIYDSVFFSDSTKTMSEIQTLVNRNSDYIVYTVDSTDEYFLPVYSHVLQRYMANEDGLFMVSDYVTRLFESGTVSTSSSNLSELMSLSEEDLDYLDTTEFFYGKIESDEIPLKDSPMVACKSNPSIDYNILQNSEFVFRDSSIPHKNHSYVTKKIVSKKSGIHKVELSIRTSVSFITPTFGWQVIPYVECQTYKKFWGWGPYVKSNAKISGRIKLLTCVGEDVIKTTLNLRNNPSPLFVSIVDSEIDNFFVSAKKYIHFRGSNSAINSTNVPLSATIYFGDQTSL